MLDEYLDCQGLWPTGDKACAAQNFELLSWGLFIFLFSFFVSPVPHFFGGFSFMSFSRVNFLIFLFQVTSDS